MAFNSNSLRSAISLLYFVEMFSLFLGCRTNTSVQELREDGLEIENFQPEIELLQSNCFVQNHYYGDVNPLAWEEFKTEILTGTSGGIKEFESELKSHADFRPLLQSFVLIGNSN